MAKFFKGIEYDKLEEGAELTLIYEHINKENNLREVKTTHTIYAADDGLYIKDETQKRYIIDNHKLKNTLKNLEDHFMYCIFINDISFSEMQFTGDPPNFNNAIFGSNISFVNTKFVHGATFENATFGSKINFSHAKFNNHTNFKKSNFNSAYFNNTTFCDKFCFESVNFHNQVEFQNAEFGDGTTFNNIHAKNTLDFTKAQFGQFAHFINSNFGETKFKQTTFNRGVIFEETIFSNKLFFNFASFNDGLIFKKIQFKENVSFLGLRCNTITNFQESSFEGETDFTDAILDKASFIDSTIKGPFILFCSVVDTLFFINITIKTNNFAISKNNINFVGLEGTNISTENASDRNTLNTFKNVFLKQNDQIKAIEFHTLEMERYSLDLQNEEGKWKEKFILWFEKNVSYFGTDYIRPFVIYLIWACISYGIILLFSGQSTCADSFLKYISPVSYDLNKVFGEAYTSSLGVGLFFLFYKITQFVLIYEIIKSFRKYSRKL